MLTLLEMSYACLVLSNIKHDKSHKNKALQDIKHH